MPFCTSFVHIFAAWRLLLRYRGYDLRRKLPEANRNEAPAGRLVEHGMAASLQSCI